MESHPDVVLMPAAFLIVERSGNEPWTPGSSLHATAHDARRTLVFALTWMQPRTRGLIPCDAETDKHVGKGKQSAWGSSSKMLSDLKKTLASGSG
ncbi:DUF5954 family protein [Streptomyces sp. NPDC058128]|uniref:DUF5954 family protein n=1 Tax=Streptomyces sp. NPDC058128 TaxID=3346352 RepID=UPI0036EB1AB8